MAHPHYGTPYMGTDGRWNGANSPIDPWRHGNEGGAERGYWRVLDTRRLDPRVDPLHREVACPGGTQGGLNCLTHAPPALSDAEEEADGNGYIRDGRAEGSLGPPPVLASVNLVPLLWTGVPTPSTPVDRQAPLPIFRCPGNAFMLRSGLP